MAITWGAASNGVRIGVQQRPYPAPNSGTSSITAVYEIYIDRKVRIADSSNSLSWSGNAVPAGSGGPFGVSGTGQKLVTTVTGSPVTLSYGSTQTRTINVSASNIDYAGRTLTVSAPYTFPARPYAAPAVPTVAVSGTGTTRTITVSAASTASAPAQRIAIQRSVNGAAWTAVGTVNAASGSLQNAVPLNAKIVYRAQSSNSSAASAWSAGSTVYTTPAAPTALSGVKQTDGSVSLSLKSNSPYASKWNVRDTPDGQTWNTVATGYSGTWPWRHANPPLTPHTYQVQAVTPDGQTSAWSSSSNTIVMLQAPLAPSGLAPTTIQPLDEAIRLTWIRSHPDYTPQTAYQLKWRVDDGTWTEQAPVTSSTSAASLTVTSGATLEWEARTKGLHPAWGPYSASAYTPLGHRPLLEIASPDPAVGTSRLVVELAYGSPDDSPQASAYVEVQRPDGSVRFSAVLGPGETIADFSSDPLEEGNYTIVAVATDSRGLESLPTDYAIVVDYLPPAPVVLTDSTWDLETGTLSLGLSSDPGDGTTTADTETVSVLWAGDPTRTVAAGLAPNEGVVDEYPLLTGQTYRLVSWSLEGAMTEVLVRVEPDPTLAGWWYVHKPGSSCRFRAAATRRRHVETSADVRHYLGRSSRVSTYGEASKETTSVDFTLLASEGASWEDVREVALELADAVVRSPDGKRFWCVVSASDASDRDQVYATASLTFEHVEDQWQL